MGEEAFVKIGIGDVYQILQRVVEGNQRLEAKVETALSNQTLRLEQAVKDLTKLEVRLEAQRKEFEEALDEQSRRLDTVDRRPVVTPKMVAAVVSIATTIITIAVGVIGLIIKGG